MNKVSVSFWELSFCISDPNQRHLQLTYYIYETKYQIFERKTATLHKTRIEKKKSKSRAHFVRNETGIWCTHLNYVIGQSNLMVKNHL